MLLAQGQVHENPDRQINSHERPNAQVQEYQTAFKLFYPAEHTLLTFCSLCREMPQPSACKLLIQHSAEQEESRKQQDSLRSCQ
jgi:hypothetical protein